MPRTNMIAKCYDLVISCMSGPFRSSCRYRTHSLRVHQCRIQDRHRSRQPRYHSRVQIPWKEGLKCHKKLVILFYFSWFLVQFESCDKLYLTSRKCHSPGYFQTEDIPNMHQRQKSNWLCPIKIISVTYLRFSFRFLSALLAWLNMNWSNFG